MTMRKEFGPMGARLRSEHGASEVPPSTHMDDYRVYEKLLFDEKFLSATAFLLRARLLDR